MFSVNVCREGRREESKELPGLSLFTCMMATLKRNAIGCNRGLVYRNIVASDRGPGSQEVGQEPGLVEKNQKYKIGRNKVYWFMGNSANTIQICMK